MTIIKIEKWN